MRAKSSIRSRSAAADADRGLRLAYFFLAVCCAAIMMLAKPAAAMENETAEAGIDTAPQFVEVLTKNGVIALTDQSINTAERHAQLQQTFEHSFAGEEIARLLLGRHWTSATPQERVDFMDALANFVADAVVENFPAGTFEIFAATEIDSPRPEAQRFEVNTVLVAASFSSRIVWVVDIINGEPKVLDITINGRSFLQSQKDEFGHILRRNGGSIRKLIEEMTS